jgi:hypothetical protein
LGHFTSPEGKTIVRHERYFLTISQQKPRKRYFGEKKIFFKKQSPEGFRDCYGETE